ncbi:MAG: COX15/CtaA family protein [Asticcacaulis sp.]
MMWLFMAAFLIVALVCVGGATRATQSGLSITEWKPVAGVIPPGNDRAWNIEFDNYRQIPQFKEINPDMTLDQFKGIYWWEWVHRMLARLLGLVYLAGFALLLIMQQIPRRLIWRAGVLVGLVLLQGLVGWWMVASGLEKLDFVAAERLATHLFLALLLLMGSLWTAMEAEAGETRGRGAPQGWKTATGILLGVIVLQCLFGALVAGNRAGLVYNDFPLMNGQFFPPVQWAKGIGYSFLHDQGLVQFMHRLNAFVLLGYAIVYAVLLGRKCHDDGIKLWANGLAAGVCLQVALGIATLISVVQIDFALAHQLVGVSLVIVATVLAWKIARADRVFRMSGF